MAGYDRVVALGHDRMEPGAIEKQKRFFLGSMYVCSVDSIHTYIYTRAIVVVVTCASVCSIERIIYNI